MALFIPDISHHQAGISIQALKDEGAAALIARVGQAPGVTRAGKAYGLTQDREWVRHRNEARRVGLPLVAYWYVGNQMSANAQAATAASWVGDAAIPWMIDHEDASGDISFYRAVVAAFEARGLRVVLGYVPKWYYDAVGGGSLKPGPPIVNSRYSTAKGSPARIYAAAKGDAGNGWTDFGNQKTVLWQFSSQATMAGRAIDCSAFRGTHQQLMDIIEGDDMAGFEQSDRDALVRAGWRIWAVQMGMESIPKGADADALGIPKDIQGEPVHIVRAIVEIKEALAALKLAGVDPNAVAAALASKLVGQLTTTWVAKPSGGPVPGEPG